MKQASLAAVALLHLPGRLLVVGRRFYVVDETEQVVITQFGEPVGDPVTTPGLQVQGPVHPEGQLLRQAVPGVGRRSQPAPHQGQALHLRRHLRALAHHRSAAVLPAAARRARRPVAPRRHPRRRDPQHDRQAQPDRGGAHHQPRVPVERRGLYRRSENCEHDRSSAASSPRAGGARQRLRRRTADLGIEILDFRFKRINYVEEVRREVYARMISERQRIAERVPLRGRGRGGPHQRREGARAEEHHLRGLPPGRRRSAARPTPRPPTSTPRPTTGTPSSTASSRPWRSTGPPSMPNTMLLLSTDGEFLRYLEKAK